MGLNVSNLSELLLGETAVIESFTDTGISLKLLEMGCAPGESVKLEKIAPLGDPIAIAVAGCLLSLRKSEASTVIVRRDRTAPLPSY